MATLDFVQTNFTRGELSPRIRGRIDFQGYYNGVEELDNFIVLPLGGVMKRPGTRFVAEAQDSDKFSRLVPFEFSVSESYALEFGDRVIRFFANGGIFAANEVSTALTNPDFSNGSTGWSDKSTGGTARIDFTTASGYHVPGGGNAALLVATASEEVVTVTNGDFSDGFFGWTPSQSGSGLVTVSDDGVMYFEERGDPSVAEIEQKINIPVGKENDNIVFSYEADPYIAGSLDVSSNVYVSSTSGGSNLYNAQVSSGQNNFTVNPNGNSEIFIRFRHEYNINSSNTPSGMKVKFIEANDTVPDSTAILEQEVTIPGGDENTIHSLNVVLDEVDGTKSLGCRLRIGTSSGANDILERDLQIGWHLIDVDPQGNSTLYIQFFKDNLTSNLGKPAVHFVDFQRSGPLELTSPYPYTETTSLNWTQSADVLFLTHPNYFPRELRRFGRAEFSLVPYDFKDGPYQGVNPTSTELTPDGISGRVTLSANSTQGINGGDGFQDADRGRLIRLQTTEAERAKFSGDGITTKFNFDFFVPDKESLGVTLTNTGSGTTQNIAEGSTVDAFEGTDYTLTLNNPEPGGTVDFSASKAPASGIEVTIIRNIAFWGWAEIVKVNSSTEVEVVVRGDSGLGGAAATRSWRLGEWSQDLGWPQTATFHNERLTFGGSDSAAQTLWMSKPGDFNSFSPSTVDGTVNADNGINITLATSQVNFIRWLSSINSGLAVGTSGAEFLIRPATATDPLGPNSIEAVRQTTRGSAAFVPPARVGLSTIFAQRGNETIRELAFDFNVDGLVARDFSIVSEHLLKPGVFRIDYQQNPDSILWMVRGDSRLLGFTLESDQEVFAWHRHTLGGTFNGLDPSVETLSVTTEGGKDRVWMVVKRTINNTTKRHVEFMEFPWINSENPIEDAFFVDSGLTGDFTGNPQTKVTGLDHLEGETVTILIDGATHPDRTVENGEIELNQEAEKVHVGLDYTAKVRTFPMDEGIRGQVSRGKQKRISQIHVLFHETVGALFGQDSLDRMPFRDSSIPMGQAVSPFSGNKSFRMPARHGQLAFTEVKSDQPLPCTILNITAEMEFYDT